MIACMRYMLFVLKQAKPTEISSPSLKFDQPLYIEAISIAMKTGLNIVTWLGSFHTITSFLGATGHLVSFQTEHVTGYWV
jgi:Na+-driven multidrug efflux pump